MIDIRAAIGVVFCLSGLMGCTAQKTALHQGGLWAPGVDTRKEAVDPLVTGHRLMAAGQYELALDSFTRAGLVHGLNGEVLSSLGSANLALGRLGQAEDLLRQSVAKAPDWPEALNNLGVVLMEQGKYPEAEQYLRRAVAFDNGESDAIRENLRVALANLDTGSHNEQQEQPYQLIQNGGGSYLLKRTP